MDYHQKLYKFCFKHLATGKQYVVGAPSKDKAIEMVSDICGDLQFEEIDLPKEYS